MTRTTFLINYWQDMEKQDKQIFIDYFHPDAVIYLHDTNEKLAPKDYISADDGSGKTWNTTVDRIDQLENGQTVTVTFHRSKEWIGFVTSFFTFKDDKIIELHEYYAPCDDNIVPQWRDDLAEHERLT